jgi:hypothetical protein
MVQPSVQFRLLLRILGIVATILLFVPAGFPGEVQEVSADAVRILKQKLLARINADRQQAKLPPLFLYDELSRLADDHCREMLAQDYLSHWNRAGQKSYIRYSLGGIIDHIAERAGRIKEGKFTPSLDNLEVQLLKIHDNYAFEPSAETMQRWTLLEPHHTHAGIGFAFDQTQVIMIEAFASRYVTLDKPFPARATLSQKLRLEGKISVKGFEVKGLSVYYEPFPVERSIAALRSSGTSGGGEALPKDYLLQRAILPPGLTYPDGTRGTLETNGTKFKASIPFFKDQPGVYTLVVWAKESRLDEPFFMATTMCIFVENDKPAKAGSRTP